MDDATRPRVLMADDDPLVRRMVRAELANADVTIVGEAEDGEQAVQMALELRPDLLLMDVHMPRRDGIAATELIAAQAPEVRVLMLSVTDDEELGLLALRAGAIGYLNKGIEMGALARIVRGVARGEAAINRTMTRRLITEYRALAYAPEAGASGSAAISQGALGTSELSPREAQVLALLAEGTSTEEVSSELGLATETVRTHVKSVLRKLRVRSRAEAIEVFRASSG